MPAQFSERSERTTFKLAPLTKQQIKALILDLDMDATAVVERAIDQLWRREIGEPDRDLAAEIDEIKSKLNM